jgi:hypothetical protein
MNKTLRKWRRRKGGIYLWRTRKHAHPSRRENGYVGLTNSFKRRERDHKGQSAYLQEDGTVKASTEKPWMDLDPKVYRIIQLPWWLCWHWVMRPLETLVILILWPRYNHAKNLWNPRRVSLSRQKAQRAERDAAGRGYRMKVRAAVWSRYAIQALGAILVIGGLVGYWTTNH